MDDHTKKVIVVGFNKGNGVGAHKDVACTITTGGNAGVVIVQIGRSPTVSASEKKSPGCNCWIMDDDG